jgi:riboflavin synthase
MFTGIIEHLGTVTAIRATSGGKRLTLDAGPCAADLKPGASLAVSGVCLTVVSHDGDILSFDVIAETLRRSNLGSLSEGGRVNLERSLRVGDRVDGHFVQGHVDGLAHVDRREDTPAEFVLWLRPDPELLPYIVPKGGVALDGVSLTIADVAGERFSVALIPTTLERTTLGDRKPGDIVNVETDLLARVAVHQLRRAEAARTVDMALLAEHGFLEPS